MEYTLQHSCFNCRKSFKKHVPGRKEGQHRDEYFYKIESQIEYKCPDCQEMLHPMGKNFKAPKKSKIEQWEVIETLYNDGFRFISTNCHKSDPLPTKKSEVMKFLKDNQKHPLRITASKNTD